ncbi:MAG: hypothetical protein VX498_10160 [Myxococcota bacterium]|nr:hypothetical protein [Myxococcota bacterium]
MPRTRMNRNPRVFGLVLVAACLVLPSALWAQEAGADSAVTSSDISGQNLNSGQKTSVAEKAVADLDLRIKRTLKMIEEARKNKDIILLNCLNDKLLLLRGLHKVAINAKMGLAEAVARENVDLEEHNFRKIFIAGDQGGIVAAEAEACVGQVGTSFPGQTQVVMRYEGTTEADQDFGAAPGGNTRPPDASPFQ